MQEIKEMLFDGTSEEFRRIVEDYKLLLYSVVYAASAYAEADDIVQETFIYAYYHWGTLRDKEKLSSWLCAIAKNKSARAMKTSDKTVSLDTVEKSLHVSSPESAVLRRERSLEIREKIGRISEKYRETVMLHYFAEKSISEISVLLDVPEGTVKFRLHEGRKQLRKELLYMMNDEKKNVEEKDIWKNIQADLQRAIAARLAYQKGEANAICDALIKQFKDMNPALLSKEEIRVIIGVYTQKYCANMHLEPREKNIVYIEKCVELAELSGDESFMQTQYSVYAGELSNLGKNNDSIEYYEKSLTLAEKLKNVPQIALLNYWLGSSYLHKDTIDVTKAKAHFEKAVIYKDELWESDYGKYIYTLAYSAFVSMNRANDIDKIIGFSSSAPDIEKTEKGLKPQGESGFIIGAYAKYCAINVISYMTRVKPFLSNDIQEGYHFETDKSSFSKTPVRSRYEIVSMNARAETPAGIFENCLHVRYIDQTEDEINFKRNGVCDLFYAPNVGLVLLHFKAIGDFEFIEKLTEYAVTPVTNGDLCDRYLPLTVGNVWYYDVYGADGTRFDKVDYENRFEVVTKRIDDTVTSIAHSGWICGRCPPPDSRLS